MQLHDANTGAGVGRPFIWRGSKAAAAGFVAGAILGLMVSAAMRPRYVTFTGLRGNWEMFHEAAATSIVFCSVFTAAIALAVSVAAEAGFQLTTRRAMGAAGVPAIVLAVANGMVLLGDRAAAYDPLGIVADAPAEVVFCLVFGLLWNVMAVVIWRSLRRRPSAARAVFGSLVVLACVGVAMCFRAVRGTASTGSQLRRAMAGVRPSPEQHRPNVLFVVLDTLRADYVGCYGHSAPTTPNLDRLAGEGVRFDSAVAPAGWTTPSHASMFTGLQMGQHGVDNANLILPNEAVTLAELLAAVGYQTFGASANPNMDHSRGFAQGFAEWYQTLAAPRVGFLERTLVGRVNRFVRDRVSPRLAPARVLPTLEADKGTVKVLGSLLDWFGRRYDPARPFFAFANIFEVHEPYRAPLRYRRMFMSDAELRRSYNLDGMVSLEGATVPEKGDGAILRKLYQAAARYQDDRLAAVFSFLRGTGLLDSTLVIVVSDHGEHLGERGLWGHREGVYQTLAHVPLVIRYPPRFPAGGRVKEVVQGCDLFATVLSVCGLEMPPGPYLALRDLSDLANVANWPNVAVTDFRDGRQWPSWGYRRGPWKFIHGGGEFRRPHELFDLSADPAEADSVWAAESQKGGQLAAELQAWLEACNAHCLAATRPAYRPNQEDRRRLRDLGYIQ